MQIENLYVSSFSMLVKLFLIANIENSSQKILLLNFITAFAIVTQTKK